MRAFLFDTMIANKVGVEAAVVLQNMDYIAGCDYFYDCELWINLEELNDLFPFFTKRKIKKLLEILANEGYVKQEIYIGGGKPEYIYQITDKGYLMMGE